jgi:anti-sigma regulatory factor (Ser/Thr protein kinase)
VSERIPGLDLATYYRAALDEASIGGDFYDVFAVDQGLFALVLGDLSGKGLMVASQLAMVRNMLRYTVYRNAGLAEAITELNVIIARQNLIRGFASLFVGIYDVQTHDFTYVSAGHEPGLLRRAASGQIEELNPTGMLLGVVGDERYAESTVRLCKDDVLILYTDGISEAGPRRKERLGIARLESLVSSQSAEEGVEALVERLMGSVEAFAEGYLRDDACVLAALVTEGAHVGASPMRRERLARTQEESRLGFYREVLQAVTGGRLLLCSEGEIKSMVSGEPVLVQQLDGPYDASQLRRGLHAAATEWNMNLARIEDLCTCAMEGAANALKHGGGGLAQAWASEGEFFLLITDSGPGISPTNLARATLERGFSTRSSLGMGFTMMLETVDTMALATSNKGTQLLLRVGSLPRLTLEDNLAFRLAERM